MNNTLVVGGTFNEQQGKPSGLVAKLASSMGAEVLNGGNLDELKAIDFAKISTLIWMPNVDNSHDKILPYIKTVNPRMTLISSKRVVEKDYRPSDVVGRLLKTKSNLGIMITKKEDLYNFRLLDPLGNMYCDTTDIKTLGTAISARLQYLSGLTRLPSVRVGSATEVSVSPEFIDVVKRLGTIFASHVNAVNPNRLLGNAATRCSYGFPAAKTNDGIWVTRRNVNKETLTPDQFVKVTSRTDVVEYYGESKPSVDTPVQVRLFNHYPNIQYMIHGHVYCKDAPTTDHKIPCGFVEEFGDIVSTIPDQNCNSVVVNLKGHGCLIACNDLSFFDSVKFVSRGTLEE
jgi:hypothetical protein